MSTTNADLQQQLRDRIAAINTRLTALDAAGVDGSEGGVSVNITSMRASLLAERTQCFEDIQKLDNGKTRTRYGRAV